MATVHPPQRGLLEELAVAVEQRHAERPACNGGYAVHAHAALLFLVEGRVAVEQRARFELEAGDVLLVPAGERHHVRYERAGRSWGVGFDAAGLAGTELAPLLAPFERARAGAAPLVRVPVARREALAQRCGALADEAAGPFAAHRALAQRSLLALVLTELARAAPLGASASPASAVDAALSYIERRALGPLTLTEVARAVGRSPAHLTTAVRRATGQSVGAWITAARMAEARRRLRATSEPVERVAERVGYADATHFIRVFRRAHGVTPAAWRAARRAG